MNNMNNINFDEVSLKGTSLDDLNNNRFDYNELRNQVINHNSNPNLVNSLTKEIIMNLKNNNDNFDNLEKEIEPQYENIEKKNKKKKDKEEKEEEEEEDDIKISKKELKEKMKNLIEKETFEGSEKYLRVIFDEKFTFKEFGLLFAIYFLMSQDMVKDFISNYFTSLNPDETGKVSMKGVLVYGLLMCVLFFLIRKFI
jgi:hypothetical protein